MPPMSRRNFTASALAALAASASPVAAAPGRAYSRRNGAPRHPLSEGQKDVFLRLMSYRPQADPDAPYFRSHVPRAVRIAAFAPTQAHPRLDPRPGVASLSDCHGPLDAGQGEQFFKMRYGASPPGKVQVPRVLCYHDIVVGWRGTGLIPNPALIDVAHRNGALALGTIFQPDHRFHDSSVVPMKDVASRLVELAAYFGFDGYFVNFELATNRAQTQMLALIATMRELARRQGLADFHIQFYNGDTDMRELLPVRPSHPGQSYADSAMLDQGWSAYGGPGNCCSGRPADPQSVENYCRAQNFDPAATAYFGLQLYPGPGYLGLAAPAVIHPNDGAYAHGSLQIYSVEDGLRNLLRARAETGRTALAALERRFFCGGSGNPADANQPEETALTAYAADARGRHRYTDYTDGSPKPTDQITLPMTYGIANFITERSVISGPFATRFNTGEGDRFFIEGQPVSDTPWFNMGIQDLLPTWQWRIDSLDASGKRVGLTVDYDFGDAFDGGSSLSIRGPLEPAAAARLWLFKTSVPLGGGAEDDMASLVLKGNPADIACLRLGLLFADAPAEPAWQAADAAEIISMQNGWSRHHFLLSPFKGKSVAAVLLGLVSPEGERNARQIAINIGELYMGKIPSDGIAPPPAELMVERRSKMAGTEGTEQLEFGLRWRRNDKAAWYDIFTSEGDGPTPRVWRGRIAGDSYYLQGIALGADGTTRIEARSVDRAAPWRASEPAFFRLGNSGK